MTADAALTVLREVRRDMLHCAKVSAGLPSPVELTLGYVDKADAVAWAEECLRTALHVSSPPHVKSPELVTRQRRGRAVS